jgi:hypothetical protein
MFNYSLKENILYGDLKASNERIVLAAKTANATEFIESSQLKHKVEDTNTALCAAFEKEKHKKGLIDLCQNEEEYSSLLADI